MVTVTVLGIEEIINHKITKSLTKHPLLTVGGQNTESLKSLMVVLVKMADTAGSVVSSTVRLNFSTAVPLIRLVASEGTAKGTTTLTTATILSV